MTYLFLAVLACTLALGGWLIARTDVDLHFHRLSDRAARKSAFENAARVWPPWARAAPPEPRRRLSLQRNCLLPASGLTNKSGRRSCPSDGLSTTERGNCSEQRRS